MSDLEHGVVASNDFHDDLEIVFFLSSSLIYSYHNYDFLNDDGMGLSNYLIYGNL